MATRAAWSRYLTEIDVFLGPVELHAGLPTRRTTVRRAHDHNSRRGAPEYQPALLDLVRVIARATRGGRADRANARRPPRRHPDRRAALRGRDGNHLRRTAHGGNR